MASRVTRARPYLGPLAMWLGIGCGSEAIVQSSSAAPIPTIEQPSPTVRCEGRPGWTISTPPLQDIPVGGWAADRLLLFGPLHHREGYVFQFPNEWTRMAPAPRLFLARTGWGAVSAKRLFVWNETDAASYDPEEDALSPMAPMGGHASSHLRYPWHSPGGKAHLAYLGVDETSSPNTLAAKVYTVADDRWDSTPVSSTLTAPYSIGVWAGATLLLWGGSKAVGTPTDTGARFDTASWTWTPMTTRDAPPPMRVPAAAVWTGERFFVWGGLGENAKPVRAGGLYDPARDAWTRVTDEGAPKDSAAFAVWTGSEVITFGGYGIYSPSHDRWRPLESPPRDAIWQVVEWDGCRVLAYGSGRLYTYQPPPDQ